MKKKPSLSRNWDTHMQESLAKPGYAHIYLQTSFDEYLKDDDLKAFLASLKHLVKAKSGIAKLAKDTGLGRESLYKALSPRGNPQFRTVMKIIDGLGMRLKVEPVSGRH